jgi:hypothetical protein
VWSRLEHVHLLELVSIFLEVSSVSVLEDSSWIQQEHFAQMLMNALMILNAHMGMAAR